MSGLADRSLSLAQQLLSLANQVQALEQEATSLRLENRRLRNQVARLSKDAEGLPPDPQGIKPWELLGVPPGADAGQVMAAFRRLSKTHHPDAATGDRDLFERLVLARDTMLGRSA
jgi:DnaJ-domain-containing protein 1